MPTIWRSLLAVITFRVTVPARLCLRHSSIYWFHTRITIIAAFLVRAEMLPYDQPAASFGSFELGEQGITLTLQVTQETSLSGVYVPYFSANIINY